MHRRSGIKIMGKLIGLVKPLLHVMTAAIFLGVVGYLFAIFLTILAGVGILHGLGEKNLLSLTVTFGLLIAFAICRGILHYGEQACNHYIAFKLLAIIRHKVFSALRKLAPAKLEGKDKGNLISIITSDIELLEVFYAHTISPIAIAFLTSLFMAVFIGYFYLPAGILALAGYLAVGVWLPLWNSKRGSVRGMKYRNDLGEMNSFVLDNLRGLHETIQYGRGDEQKKQMRAQSEKLSKEQEELQKMEGGSRSATNLVILLFSCGMLFLMLFAYTSGYSDFTGVIICTIAMMGSFGPVAALSSLSNNLNQTLASGERVLSLLEEEPEIKEVTGKAATGFSNVSCRQVSFAYGKEEILKDYSLKMKEGEIIGIYGKSGSGKSTLLKLLMRFFDVQKGSVKISDKNVRDINTSDLRNMESYVTQETYLFHDSIGANIAIANPGASREDIIAAAKKASIHEFIEKLPGGYDTPVGELGDTLSGGERQRIGIARAFLHNAPFLLLDEPTSSLDSLNEGIVLKSLQEACRERTVLLVSHRQSTMNITDRVYRMTGDRAS